MTRTERRGGLLARPEAPGERWSELVELYEYRVADSIGNRAPRGGRRALVNLREELLCAPLEPALYRRLLEADRLYRAHQKVTHQPQAVRHATPPPVIWEAPLSGESEEARAWQDLHLLAWGDTVRATFREQTQGWLREPNLMTLRVLYAALENAERADQAGQAGRVPFGVPAVSDPLSDLHDPQVLQELAEAAAALLLEPGGRARLEAALAQVHDVPFPRHPDEDVLRARVQAAEREPLSPQAKDTLIQALQTQHPAPRDPRERPAIRQAARDLAHSLEPLLAGDPQARPHSVPSHCVLYAAQPNTALRAPDDGADELVVHLAAQKGMRWRGTDFQWQAIGPHWQLQAGGQVALLRPLAGTEDRQVTLKLAGAQFRAFISGAYLLLRAQTSPQEELTRLASLGRAVALLLSPAGNYAALRLARAAAQHLREGRVDAAALSESSAAKYALASPGALLGFARKGAEALCAHMALLAPHDIQRTLHDCALALGLDDGWDHRLGAALEIAAHQMETLPPPLKHSRIDLSADGSFACVALRDDPPLTLQFGARAITLRRDFRREWAAIMPGYPPLGVQDLSITRLPDCTLVLARHGDWLAAAAQPVAPQPAQPQLGQPQPGQPGQP